MSEPELQPPAPKRCARCHQEAVYPARFADGLVCMDCMTVEEQRLDAFQCERCGAQYHDGDRMSDAGWIVEPDRFLCPDCMTVAEDVADTLRFIDTVRRGQRITTREGREYPADLALLAELQIGRVVRLVRDAGLSAQRLCDLSQQLSQKDLSPEEFAAANPDVAPIIQALVNASTAKGHSAQWARDLLLILSIILTLYFGAKQNQLAQEQVDLAREQIRQDEQHRAHAPTTQNLTDKDISRVVQAIQQAMQAHDSPRPSAPPEPARQTQTTERSKTPKTYGPDKR